jgi:haloacetate dehalogenase
VTTPESVIIDTATTTIHARCTGSGPGLLLLHGFPETSLMWRDVAPLLADRFTVVCADLRGYGASGCPGSAEDHVPYSKRALADDMVAVMASLGFDRFAVAGHDRGGRVAYRLALDHPRRIERLAVLDIVPIDVAWQRADDRLALAFWPWSLLAAAEPLPERLIGAAPEAVVDHALSAEWGTPASTFGPEVRAEYVAQLRDPDHLHAICEEYRAAAGIDRAHDRADRDAGRSIGCPLLTLWSGSGPLASWYADLGGPLGVWRSVGVDVCGRPVEGGHFFAEEHPAATAEALREFFVGSG